MTKTFFSLMISLITSFFISNSVMAQIPEVFQTQHVEVYKVWDKAINNSFTDLIRYKGKFYCSFREGTGHTPGKTGLDGQIRVLSSVDGEKWMPVALLKKEGIDLRDPKLSVTPDGRLMMICGGSLYNNGPLTGRIPHVSFFNLSDNKFTEPQPVTIDPEISSGWDWIWRVTWHNNVGYAIDYQISREDYRLGTIKLFLLKTNDGIRYEKVTEFHNIDGFPNESTIRFDNKGRMYILVRRETQDTRGMLLVGEAPYKKWTSNRLSFRLGGPNFLFLNTNKLIIGSRRNFKDEDGKNYENTGIMVTDLNGKINKTIFLPSGGDDTGYPGLVIYQDTLWVSYYSKHEGGNTSIYLAKIPIKDLVN